jgi:aromatic-L-amino-acid/L-tryptophan decarboxylase
MVRPAKLWCRRISEAHSSSKFPIHLSRPICSYLFNLQGIELNNLFATLVQDSVNLSLVTQPSLALTVFRLVPRPEADEQLEPPLTLESVNDLNRLLYSRLCARDDIMLTQTTLNGLFCIRLAVGATRTTEIHIRTAFDVIYREAETALEILAQTPKEH